MFTVIPTKHSMKRWRKRYGQFDTDDQIGSSMSRRVSAGLLAHHGLSRAKRETILQRFTNGDSATYQEQGKIVYAGLTYVIDRRGMEVTVITVY